MLTEEQIKVLKEKFKAIDIDEQLFKDKNWINIKELYLKVNRSPSEEMILLKYAVITLITLDVKEEFFTKALELQRNIELRNGAQWWLNFKIRELFSAYHGEITWCLKVVYEDLLGDELDESD